MISTIYIIILSYFIIGGVGFYFINRNKEKEVARESWTKFITYLFIIHILFFSIVLNPLAFRVLSGLIIIIGLFELFRLFKGANYAYPSFFILSILVYGILSYGLIVFGSFDKEIILFAFLILSIFDAFSQISGQLFGKTKIAPNISPNKTIEGTIGGALIAILGALLLNHLYNEAWYIAIMLAAGVVISAFFGDILASLYKRKFKVKDYSKLIPGHGGLLDRFDSLIAGGACAALFVYVLAIFN